MGSYANNTLGNTASSSVLAGSSCSVSMAMNTSGDSTRILIISEYFFTAVTVKSQYDKVISRAIPF